MSPNDILQGSPDNNFPNFTYDEKDIEIEGI